MKINKKTIAIIFGGVSPEYTVSLSSAYAVICAMDRTRYNPIPIGVDRDGRWFYYTGDPEKIRDDTWREGGECIPALLSPDRGTQSILIFKEDGTSALPIDAAFPVMHGKNGEDGTVQGLITLAGIPLIGCGVSASALCMDKFLAHTVAQACGVAVPPSALVRRAECDAAQSLADRIGYPLFVKPVGAGSSFGVSKVVRPDDLSVALETALRYDNRAIIERQINGIEVGCAVIGFDRLRVGAVDEIELSDGFFDYTEKYTLKTSAIHVPARISDAQAEQIRQTACIVYRALGCSGFARVDLFLSVDGTIYFNEVNTIPGFTEHSRFPAMMRAAGMEFPDLLTELIEQAVRQ